MPTVHPPSQNASLPVRNSCLPYADDAKHDDGNWPFSSSTEMKTTYWLEPVKYQKAWQLKLTPGSKHSQLFLRFKPNQNRITHLYCIPASFSHISVSNDPRAQDSPWIPLGPTSPLFPFDPLLPGAPDFPGAPIAPFSPLLLPPPVSSSSQTVIWRHCWVEAICTWQTHKRIVAASFIASSCFMKSLKHNLTKITCQNVFY